MKSIKLAAILAIALFSFSAADAQVVKNKKDRARVKQGVKSGELTKHEVKEIRKIEKEKKEDIRAAKADGVVTAAEKKEIRKDERRSDRAIYRKKHNRRDRN